MWLFSFGDETGEFPGSIRSGDIATGVIGIPVIVPESGTMPDE